METTYVNRANSNARVFNEANQKLQAEGRTKRIGTFIEAYKKAKRKRAIKILNLPTSSLHKVTFQNGQLIKWTHLNRRVGRPRANWTEETLLEIWDIIKQTNPLFRFTSFDHTNQSIIDTIASYEED